MFLTKKKILGFVLPFLVNFTPYTGIADSILWEEKGERTSSLNPKEVSGSSLSSIFSKAYEQGRVVKIEGLIHPEMWDEFRDNVAILELKSKKDPIVLLINTVGGCAATCQAMVNLLEGLEAPLTTVAIGLVASSGVPLFLTGDERILLPHATLMIHGGSSKLSSPTREGFKDLSKQLESFLSFYETFLSQKTGLSLDEMRNLLSKDFWMSAKEALELGFGDKIDFQFFEKKTSFLDQSKERSEEYQAEQEVDPKTFSGPEESPSSSQEKGKTVRILKIPKKFDEKYLFDLFYQIAVFERDSQEEPIYVIVNREIQGISEPIFPYLNHLTLYDILKGVHSKLIFIGEGEVGLSSTLLLSGGEKNHRFLNKGGYFSWFNEPLNRQNVDSISEQQLLSSIEESKRQREVLLSLISKKTGISLEKMKELTRNEIKILLDEEALELGLIDALYQGNPYRLEERI